MKAQCVSFGLFFCSDFVFFSLFYCSHWNVTPDDFMCWMLQKWNWKCQRRVQRRQTSRLSRGNADVLNIYTWEACPNKVNEPKMCRCHHSRPKPVGGFQCVSVVSAPAGLFAALPVNEMDAFWSICISFAHSSCWALCQPWWSWLLMAISTSASIMQNQQINRITWGHFVWS